MTALITKICATYNIYKFKGRVLVCLVFGLISIFLISSAQAESLQVLNWWSSTSEHAAVDVIAARLQQEDIDWNEVLIPSGSGVAAMIVLKSRIIAGEAPEVAQLNGTIIGDWANLGLLQNLDTVADIGKWDKLLFPAIYSWTRPHGHAVVAPLGIHRVNTLLYNTKIFDRLELDPPQSWNDLLHIATVLQKAGISVLAQSSEPWQVSTLFESIVLAESGASFYRDIFVNMDPKAYADERFTHALKRLRTMKKWMQKPIKEQNWTDVTRQFANGEAAMMVMGDWAKGELNSWGLITDDDFGCTAVPGTGNYHLFDIDTLAMFVSNSPNSRHILAQQKLASIVVSPGVQNDYNQIKGSISVLRNPDLSRMDSCARASWSIFSRGASVQVPSFTHRMATDETSRDTIINELHQFFMDDNISVEETQRRFVLIANILRKSK
jgi:glucose/mannose transport system substrate-binding protein